MDAAGHVHDVVYLRYLEEARIDMLHNRSLASGNDRIGKSVVGKSVVGKTEITYLRPLAYRPEPVRIDSMVIHIGAASFDVDHQIVDGETVYATAKSTIVAFDQAAGRSRRLTTAEREYISRLSVRAKGVA